MKKAFSILGIAVFILSAFSAKAQLNVIAGYAPETFTTATTVGNTTSSTTKDYNGFFLGVDYNVNLKADLNVAFGAQLRMNMHNDESTVLTVTTKRNENQILLDIPIMLNYGFGLGRDARMTLFAGPMVSFALQGNTKITTHSTVTTLADTETNTEWYGDNSSNERLNLSGVFGVMLGFREYRLFGGYRMGFLDLNNDDNIKTTTAGIFIGLGMAL
ncbi:MAG: outer membrane beta-barrel protein [Bacteroidales bacterium]|nr:outer membrane beta-barrel protein [Bacteroidales bacterium]